MLSCVLGCAAIMPLTQDGEDKIKYHALFQGPNLVIVSKQPGECRIRNDTATLVKHALGVG